MGRKPDLRVAMQRVDAGLAEKPGDTTMPGAEIITLDQQAEGAVAAALSEPTDTALQPFTGFTQQVAGMIAGQTRLLNEARAGLEKEITDAGIDADDELRALAEETERRRNAILDTRDRAVAAVTAKLQDLDVAFAAMGMASVQLNKG